MYWVAQIDIRREALAVHCLQLAEYQVYAPRVRDGGNGRHRVAPLFPSYLFVAASPHGWWRARWAPGVVRLVLGGDAPAHVSDAVVAELKSRERNGLIELPTSPWLKPAGPRFKSGDTVRINTGPLSGFTGLVAGMRGRDRVAVLLTMLGGLQPVELAAAAIEPA
jgi:transcriptional antiterminator NusG